MSEKHYHKPAHGASDFGDRLLRRLDADLQDEIRFYLEERAKEFMDEGRDADAAWKAALDAFGDIEKIEADVRRGAKTRGSKGRGWEMISSLLKDIRYAVRTLVSRPGFTLVALATLALGIGANTAMFSVVYATLFRAPPVQEPDELIAVFTTSRRGFPRSSTSYPDFLDYRDRSTRVADLAGTSSLSASLGDEDEGADFVGIVTVTGNYFSMLGVPPALGRMLQPQDDILGGGASVAVLRHDFWEDRFGADPAVIGQTVRLNQVAFEVVGVAPPEFKGMRLGAGPQIWIPMQSGPALSTGLSTPNWERRGNRWMGMSIGRLVPGSTVEQARAELLVISDQLSAEDPAARGPRSVTVDALSGYQLPSGGEAQIRAFVWLLLGVAGFTLLLACANLANLLLARASSRNREVGVRLAIGAGRGRLIRQLLTESTVLAVAGAGLGVLLAGVLLGLLGSFQLPGGVTVASLGIGLDGRLLMVALGISLMTILLFGLVPALQATRPDLVQALKGDSVRDGTARSDRMKQGLIAMQVATCAVLLVGSGLFLRTLREGLNADLGVRTEGVALAQFRLGMLQYEPSEVLAFVDELRTRVGRLPGVDAVSLSSSVPLARGPGIGFFAEVDGYEIAPDEELRVDMVFVSTEYFESIGLPLLQGRGFERSDDESGQAVIVVSESMAEKYWPNGDVIGGTVNPGRRGPAQVIGVAANTTWSGLEDDVTNYAFVPLAHFPEMASRISLTLALHTNRDPRDLLPALRTEIQALEPELPIQRLMTMEDHVNRVLMPQRMGAALLSGFGLLALLLAAMGIAGVVSFTVNQKRRDIGVRMALGAGADRVVGQLLGSMARPVVFGLVIGLVTARALARTVESFMFRVDATDPATYGLIALGMVVVTALATLLPATRATRIDPIEVLKAE